MTTTAEEFLEGLKRMEDIVGPYKPVDFACVREELMKRLKIKRQCR